VKALPFIMIHVVCLAVIFTGVDLAGVLICLALYAIRMFGITAGYHRLFAHRSYKTSRGFAFFMAVLGCSATQKGPLWWAANHRHHHKFSDDEKDPHTPLNGNGFWWSHIGWILSPDYTTTHWDSIRDWTKYPEIRFLNTFYWLPPLLLAVAVWLVGGWSGLIVGFFISTVLLYHGTFLVNSVCHLLGTRRYETSDKSRNNWWVAILTLGEGWHNNHHHYQSSARQGFFWWEVDISYYILKGLEVFGVVWGVREPPKKLLAKTN